MSEPSTKAAAHAGIFFPPPLIYVGFFLAGLLLDHWKPVRLVADQRLAAITGSFLAGAAVALAFWSIGTFWRSHTSIIPVKPSTTLVVRGPYRFTRNPMYLSMATAYVAAALIAGTPWPLFLLPILLPIVDYLVIRREERYLASAFGEPYTSYMKRVHRWL